MREVSTFGFFRGARPLVRSTLPAHRELHLSVRPAVQRTTLLNLEAGLQEPTAVPKGIN